KDDVDPEAVLLKRISTSVDSGRAADGGDTSPDQVVATISVIEGPGGTETFDLRKLPATIGSEKAADVALPGLAARHARLLQREGRMVIFNLAGPEYGEPEDADPLRLLTSGDHLTLGPYKLLFAVPLAEPSASTK